MGQIKKKKTSTKAAKAAPKIATVSAIASGKAAPRKRAATKAPKKAAAVTITPEERLKMVEQAAYFRAEKTGFSGDSHAYWVAAEAEVDALLKSQGKKAAKAKK